MADATSYYEGWRKGIGRESYQRIIATEEDIIRRPEARRSLGAPLPAQAFEAIPGRLVYHQQPEPEWFEVVAVMHLHREPDYRRKRLE